MITSWKAVTIFFRNDANDSRSKSRAQSKGFLTFLCELENLKLMAYITDVLYLFQRFHKKVQSNDLTIILLARHIGDIKKSLSDMKAEILIGGCEENLNENSTQVDGKMFLNGIEVFNTSQRRNKETAFEKLRIPIIDSIIEFMDNRFQKEKEFEVLEPFIRFERTADIKGVHSMFGRDLELPALSVQYREFVDNLPEIFQPRATTLKDTITQIVVSPTLSSHYNELLVLLSRIQVCTPHSADVERSISANNQLKTAVRNRLLVQTENKYLFVYFNMPAIDQWNPRKAVTKWINQKKHRSHDLMEKGTACKQRYYKGVFSAAKNETPSDDEEHEVYSLKNVKF